jgi:RHS repeat-associated protein
MLLSDNHFTPVIGIDIHFTTLPPFNPFQPYIGMVVDPADYIPFIGATVQVNGIKRGVSDTSGIIIPLVHIPIVGPFVMTAIIGHESMNFFSSQTVFADGTRLSPKGYMVMTCNDIGIPLSLSLGAPSKPKKRPSLIPVLFAPTSFSLPIPTGPPVMVGGPIVPDWGGALMGLVMSFGFSSLMRYGKKLFNKILKNTIGENSLSKLLCKMGFEPINLVNGNVVYEGLDFELPGVIGLQWQRKWTSVSAYVGWLGHGVHCNYDRCIELFPEEDALGLRMDDGRVVAFPLLEKGESFYLRQEKTTLTRHDYHYEAFDHASNLTYFFDQYDGYSKYRLTKITNPSGFMIQLQVIGNQLTGIIDTAGRKINVINNYNGQITKMTLETQAGEETLVSYKYDDDKNIISIADALDKATTIEYQNRLMVKKTDRNGQTFYWEYDGKKTGARCVHTWGDGGWQEGWIAYHPEEGYNLVTDANGAVTTYYYTPDQLVTQVKDPLGNSTFTEYTEFMEVYREIDQAGYATGYTYDDNGNRTSVVYPDGTTAMYCYNENNQLMIAVDPQGNQTVYTYKKKDPLVLNSILEPDNSITTFEYNELGLIKEVAKEGKKTALEYDSQYNLVAVTDDKGNQTKWDYDYKGQVRSVKSPGRYGQHYNYDKLGRVTKIQAADQNVTQLTYNAYEEVIEAKDLYHHVKFRYTPMGSLAQREENGIKVNFMYDNMEQLLKITNEHNEQYEFDRNLRGDIVQEKGFDDMYRKYQRDNAGKVVKVVRPAGKETQYEYDALGRITRTEHNDGTWETYTYNKNGQLTEARNQNVCIGLVRDVMGRVVKETQTHGILGDKGFEIVSEYDKNGNRIALKSNLGTTVTNTYTTQGQLEQIQAQSQELLAQEKEAWKAKITRNALGQEIERVVTGGICSKTEYDEAGRPIKQATTQNGRETYSRQYVWNANNRLQYTINQITNGVVTYSYDAFGSLASAKYEDGSYDYKLPDEVGNLYKTQSRKDRIYGKGGQLQQDQDWNYRYDEEGNLIQKSKYSGDQASNIFHGGTWHYTWNANGMLKNIKKPNGLLVEFEYDALGRRTAKIFNDKITRFVWDGNVLLHEWNYNLTDSPQQIVNDFGEVLLDKQEPVENLITWVYEEGSFVPSAKIMNDAKYSIISDYIGRPVQAFAENGELVWQTDYDIYGALRNLKGEQKFIPFRQLGQYEDEETGLYYNRFRYYNCETGTYLSQDPIGLAGNNPNFYGYVHDINSHVDIFGLDPLGTGGYSVYALYDKGATDPYYIGITKQDIDTRMGQHMDTGRYGNNTTHKILHEDITIEQARGQEQHLIEKHNTKTGIIGEDISATNRGNKVNSFDKTRTDARGKAFKAEYDKLKCH